ncbi:type II secretion system protein N [Ramlibacter sp. AW1]|uniref:Type II secretion system protein N n=1 Tax=Ramlibacter aurantiacus TaxID=2801330 RepID=A0A937D6X2_9BURK|nr:type II secretion system protein N [Ramlibacter aurantiacus]MBL0422737.1 type II secretion system protein N [Ramlibacter aurantiacus]
MARPLSAAVPTAAPPWTWAVLGAALGLLLAVLLFAPARWAAAAVANATSGRLLLENARGTIWNGSARMVLTGGSGSRDAAALPTRLEWRLTPAPGGFGLRVASACCTTEPIALALSPRWGGAAVRVTNGAPSQWPASLLVGLGTPWNTLDLEGDLRLSTQDLAVSWTDGRVQMDGRADLAAMRLGSRLTTLRPMGSYQLSLIGGPAPSLRLSTLPDSSLQLSGTGNWVGSRLRFNGEASAAPEREAALANLLNIIGRRQGSRSVITIG